jgi:hypothetical protein
VSREPHGRGKHGVPEFDRVFDRRTTAEGAEFAPDQAAFATAAAASTTTTAARERNWVAEVESIQLCQVCLMVHFLIVYAFLFFTNFMIS